MHRVSRTSRTAGRAVRRLAPGLAGLTALGTLAGLGSTLAASASAPAAQHGAAETVPLVVYSAQGYDKAETQAFQKATGIPVKLDDNSTGPLLTQIQATLDNPKWGLLWVDGATAFAALDEQGMLVKNFEPNVDWNSLGDSVVPADQSYVPTGVTLMAAEVYDKSKAPDPPASWKALLSPQWKGEVGMDDPSQSGPTYPFVAGMMQYLGSIAKGKAYFMQLKANGLVINATNGPTLSALGSGQINIALVQSSAGIGATLGTGGSNLGIKYLNPVTLLPSCIGIDAKAPKAEQAEAEQFATFVLSKAGQHVMQTGDPTGDSLFYPVLKGERPLPALPSLSSVKVQTINPYTWGPRESAINSWFDSNITS
jgi:iron(III) transport system substrate-binding protein